MPYDITKDLDRIRDRLTKTYSNVTDKMCRQFIHVWQSVYEKTKDEGAAFGAAHSTIQRSGARKKLAAAVYLKEVIIRKAAEEITKWERAGSRFADITGGTAKVCDYDELLLENAGPGIHLHFQHKGAVLEIRLGNGHHEEIEKLLEKVCDATHTELEDKDKPSKSPREFAFAVKKVCDSISAKCSVKGEATATVSGFRDITNLLSKLLGKRSMVAYQQYFNVAPPSMENQEDQQVQDQEEGKE